MPVPQNINFLVEQASCLLLTMVQDIRCNGCQEEGRGKKQEGRGKIIPSSNLKLKIQNSNLKTIPHITLPTSCLAASAIFDVIN
ncbi:hypothetical protein [Microcoleus sp. N3A4]|uniref:hypothetical protein n=1 Tax=Microcoleus sp. N3A4 TaxID=3055379 RepID=UPI002FD2CCEA